MLFQSSRNDSKCFFFFFPMQSFFHMICLASIFRFPHFISFFFFFGGGRKMHKPKQAIEKVKINKSLTYCLSIIKAFSRSSNACSSLDLWSSFLRAFLSSKISVCLYLSVANLLSAVERFCMIASVSCQTRHTSFC